MYPIVTVVCDVNCVARVFIFQLHVFKVEVISLCTHNVFLSVSEWNELCYLVAGFSYLLTEGQRSQMSDGG